MHMFMYNVDFIGHFAFCNYWKWPLWFNLSKTFKMAATWDSWSFFCNFFFLRFELFLDTCAI